jgi:hypothetical protein
LKKYKSPGSGQIPAELIQAGGEMLLSAIQKLIISIWNKEELSDHWKECIIVPVKKSVTELTVIIVVDITAINFIQKLYSISSSQD